MDSNSNSSKQVENNTTQWVCDEVILNKDLLIEVLFRLPCKSVIRFKCVSKYWYSVISEPTFVPRFLMKKKKQQKNETVLDDEKEQPWALVCLCQVSKHNHPIGKLELLAGSTACLDYANAAFISDLPFPARARGDDSLQLQPPVVSIVGSSDDLILCKSCYYYYICNPLTKQCTTLPPPPPPPPPYFDVGRSRSRSHWCLICEPFSISNVHHRRYRVVSVILSSEDPVEELELAIFSSETGLWSEHRLPCGREVFSDQFYNLVTARLGQNMVCVVVYLKSIVILYPFMASNNHQNIPSHLVRLPDAFRYRDRGTTEVYPSQGRLFLCLKSRNHNHPRSTLRVWELDEIANHKEWRLIHRVETGEMKLSDNLAAAHHYDDVDHELRSWVANFLKSVATSKPIPCLYIDLQPYEMACAGFHPFDANVMYLILSLDQDKIQNPSSKGCISCLVSYDMRTRAVDLVPEEKIIDNFDPLCRSKMLRWFVIQRLGLARLVPHIEALLVFQPWPTPLVE